MVVVTFFYYKFQAMTNSQSGSDALTDEEVWKKWSGFIVDQNFSFNLYNGVGIYTNIIQTCTIIITTVILLKTNHKQNYQQL